MSDTVILGILTLVSTVVTTVFAFLSLKYGKKQDEGIELGKKTLYHVNSGSLLQAGLYKVVTERVASLTKDAADIEIATAARKIFDAKTREQEEIKRAEERKV